MSPDRLSESVLKRATILGGCGQVGMLLSHSLRASGIRVTIVDASPPRIEASDALTYLRADVTAENMELKEAIAETEAVFICLPETTTLRIFPFIVSALRDESLWVDTLSVKSDVVAKLKATPG